DIVLEVFSILAAILITLVGYRAYKLTKEPRFFYFSLAFGLISLSFIARAVTAGVVLSEVGGVVSTVTQASFAAIESIFSIGRFFYFLFVLFAYLILFVLSMRLVNRRIILLLSLFMILFAASAFSASALIFYLVSLFLLIFITWQYRDNYLVKRTPSTLLSTVAFALMVVEFVLFVASALLMQPQLAAAAYLFRLTAYVILLAMIVRVYAK
ncbi:MAG TPA: hypothetical protein VLJ21_02245, partial [Candidatus Binatia bacterium]|nr:hypothetical protein [Candidatus Binatia bacterium]